MGMNVTVQDSNNITVDVTPTPTQVITISRGMVGPVGPAGESNIGGYPISLAGSPQNYDALMFVSGAWTNVPQLEIADGGNF